MSVISFFHKATVAPSVTPVAESDKNAWRSEPIRPKQCKWIAICFRQRDLTAAPAELHPRLAELAVYDDATKRWPEVGKLTAGDASDLLDMLFKLPKTGFSPVITASAEPISTGELKSGDTVVIEGVAYRVRGKGKLVKA